MVHSNTKGTNHQRNTLKLQSNAFKFCDYKCLLVESVQVNLRTLLVDHIITSENENLRNFNNVFIADVCIYFSPF